MTNQSTAQATRHGAGGERRIQVGRVLKQGFAVLFRNIVPFGFLALLLWSPFVILGASRGAPSLTDTFAAVGPWIFLFTFVIGGLLNGVLAYGTFMDLRGQRASIGACVGRGLALILPILGVVIVSTIAMAIGTMLLVIPGIIVMLMLYVAVPVAVVERPGVLAALRRSRELTKGNRWRLLAILLVVTIITQVASWIGRTVGGSINPIAGLSAEWVLSSVFGALTAVVTAVAYYELRQAKEGTSIDQLAAVFD